MPLEVNFRSYLKHSEVFLCWGLWTWSFYVYWQKHWNLGLKYFCTCCTDSCNINASVSSNVQYTKLDHFACVDQEEKAELKSQNYLLCREKRSLELQVAGKESQEQAYLVQLEHLKAELQQLTSSSSQVVLILKVYYQTWLYNSSSSCKTEQHWRQCVNFPISNSS